MLSNGQDAYYWRLWAQVRKADPNADRKAMHATPSSKFPEGLPASHKDWENPHMDEWISRCKAIFQADNYRAQYTQEEMPATRKRVFIRQLLAALDAGEEYAESIIATMQRRKKQRWTGAGAMATLDTISEDFLEGVMIALKKECRRRWKTKDRLLLEIRIVRDKGDFVEEYAAAAVMRALCWDTLPPIGKMDYEALLVTLGVLRRLAMGRPIEAPVFDEVGAADEPF
jgi:hypothetical protein